MDNQTFIIASVILCSLGGWYVVVTKYLALKQMVKDKNNDIPQHIPGMGPPPVSNIPFTIPEEFLGQEEYLDDEELYMQEQEAIQARQRMQQRMQQEAAPQSTPVTAPTPAYVAPPLLTLSPSEEKRLICNHASIMHLLGFGIISGVPFLNVLLPTVFWLWKKEQHHYIEKQGKEVINFQITFSLIQFLCLGAGVLFIRYMPSHAEKLFAFTKITRIVFSSGMYLPFNVFTVIPFFWCCIVMIRGAVAAYHGLTYKYPGTQQFLFSNNPAPKQAMVQRQPAAAPRQPTSPTRPSSASANKVSFG